MDVDRTLTKQMLDDHHRGVKEGEIQKGVEAFKNLLFDKRSPVVSRDTTEIPPLEEISTMEDVYAECPELRGRFDHVTSQMNNEDFIETFLSDLPSMVSQAPLSNHVERMLRRKACNSERFLLH